MFMFHSISLFDLPQFIYPFYFSVSLGFFQFKILQIMTPSIFLCMSLATLLLGRDIQVELLES